MENKEILQYEKAYKEYLFKWMNKQFDYICFNEDGFNISKKKSNEELYEYATKKYILELELGNKIYSKNKEKKMLFDTLIKFVLDNLLEYIKQFSAEDLVYIMYSMLKYNRYISVNLQFLQHNKSQKNYDELIYILKSIIYSNENKELNKVNAERIESFLAHHENSISYIILICFKDLKKKNQNKIPNNKELYEILEMGQTLSYLEYMKYLLTDGAYKVAEISINTDGSFRYHGIDKIVSMGPTSYNYRYDMENIEYTPEILMEWKEKFKIKFGFSYEELIKVQEIFSDMNNNSQAIRKKQEWISFFIEKGINKEVAIKIFDFFTFKFEEETLEYIEIIKNTTKGKLKFENKIFICIYDRYIINSTMAVYSIMYFINMVFNKPADYFDKSFEKKINDEFSLQVANKIKKEIYNINLTTELKTKNIVGQDGEFDIIIAYGNKILIVEAKRLGFEFGVNKEKTIMNYMKQLDKELKLFTENKEKLMKYLNEKKGFNFDLINSNKYIIKVVMLTKELTSLHLQHNNKFEIFLYDKLIEFIKNDIMEDHMESYVEKYEKSNLKEKILMYIKKIIFRNRGKDIKYN